MQEVNLTSRARGISLAALAGLQLLAIPPLAAAPGHDGELGRGRTAGTDVRAVTIPPGTDIPVTIDENIALKQNQFGKTFAAHVTRDVVIGSAVAIPAGAPATVMLVESADNPAQRRSGSTGYRSRERCAQCRLAWRAPTRADRG